MKHVIATLLTFITGVAYGQNYPFTKDFVPGTIFLKDSIQLTGELEWFPHRNEKLKFRKNQNSDVKKYSPEDLMGFTCDTLQFVSLFNLEVHSSNYGLAGKTSKIKHIFGELLDSGNFNIYFVLATGYDPVSGVIQQYPNFYFQRKLDGNYVYAAYPFSIRMKDSRYEKAKENLYLFFKDYPQIIEKIRAYKQQDDFFEIIALMKTLN